MFYDDRKRQKDGTPTRRPYILNGRRIIVYPKHTKILKYNKHPPPYVQTPEYEDKSLSELRSCNLVCFSKVSRAIVTTACICIFLYLAITFFKSYSEYPTTVDVEVAFPVDPVLPGLTICSNNYFRKSVLQKLVRPAEQWIQVFPNRSDVLRRIARAGTPSLLKYLSHQASTLFRECKFISESDPRLTNICKTSMWFYLLGRPCFVINTDWHGITKSHAKKNDTSFQMIIDLEPNEYIDLQPRQRASVDIYLHSQMEVPDSRTTHFKARGGKTYEIGLLKTTVQLLERPYQSGCYNYTKYYLKKYPNGLKEGDVNATNLLVQLGICVGETVCETMCRMKAALQKVKCIPSCLPFGENATKCRSSHADQKKKCNALTDERQKCFENILTECEVVLYDIQIDEEEGIVIENEDDSSENSTESSSSNSAQNTNITKITIDLEVTRHTIYTHSPKVSAIEALGYIGGYLGIFLGISVPMMYDTFLFLITYSNEFIRRKGHSFRHRLQLDS